MVVVSDNELLASLNREIEETTSLKVFFAFD